MMGKVSMFSQTWILTKINLILKEKQREKGRRDGGKEERQEHKGKKGGRVREEGKKEGISL